METIPLYSIIVPVYGAQAYLAEAVSSVLAQTERDFELILVDDCSPDGCPEICDRYARTDDRVRVIHKPENGGLSAARNDGLAAARGAYILFLDADDRLLPTALDTCGQAIQQEPDVLVFGVRREHENKNGQTVFEETLSVPAFTCGTKEDVGNAFVQLSRAGIFPFAWNKVYRASFLRRNELRFEDVNLIEDFVFTAEIFSRTTKIAGIPDALYVYRKPAHETLVNRYRPEFFALCKRKYQTELALLENCGTATAEHLQLVYANHVRHLISVILRNRAKSAGLGRKARASQIRILLTDASTKEVLREIRPVEPEMKLTVAVLKTGKPFLCEAFACCIGFVRTRLSQLFIKRNRRARP